MEMEEFDGLQRIKKIISSDYPAINCYEIDGAIFYIEPNFYTQLRYSREHFSKDYTAIIKKIVDIAIRNKKVIFTANFENPVVFETGFIYREIEDVLAELHLSFDNKSNPESDWKD